jgi:hypothetical protein
MGWPDIIMVSSTTASFFVFTLSCRIAAKVLLPGKSAEEAENHTLRQN